jgi:integrase
MASEREIEKYKSERKKIGRKPETINKELGAIRRMFNLALEGALKVKIGKNPIHGIKLVKVPRRKHRIYKDWEFQSLYGAAPNHFKPILLFAFMTGMWRSEITNLKWNNVDLEDRYIHVVETKNGESRSIPINDALLDVLCDIKRVSKSEFVFTTHQGKPYTSKSAWKTVWSKTLKKAGIENGRFHDFRHTFCSGLIVDEKEDYITVMGLSGHKDIRMLKRYSHTHEDAKKAAIEKLGKRMTTTTMDTFLDTKSDNHTSSGIGVSTLTSSDN